MGSSLLTTLIALACVSSAFSEYLMGGHLDNNDPKSKIQTDEREFSSLGRSSLLDALDLDLDAEESTVVSSSLSKDDEGPRYGLPFSFAFNGGRPFSLEKDPITGKIDYEKAPAVRILNYTDRYEENDGDDKDQEKNDESKEDTDSYGNKKIENKDGEDVSPNEINPNSPNFHDFLNLPVRYSSEKYTKDKYPLISSSYANTKVQSGSNSYSTYNHRPYHRETTLYYPVKKIYSPKITTTTTIKTTTTTTTTTMKPTTLRPSTTSTTPTTTTTTTTTMPTTTSTTTKAPPVTTWKPSTSTVRHVEFMDDYEDILSSLNLPIKNFQNSGNHDHQSPNNIVPPRKEPPVKLPPKKDEYDMYDDYDLHEESNENQDYSYSKEVPKESISSSTMAPSTQVSSTTPPPTQSSFHTPESTTMRITTLLPTAIPQSPSSSVVSTHPLQFQVVSHPVTSMSIDTDDREPPTFENVVDNRRPSILDSMISNTGGHQVINQRPLGIGGQILVGSTSNIVVPPDQDTVSFVLGNRQNVEGGGYHSPGTAIGENPYAGLTGVDGSFRPLYGDVSTGQDTYGLETDPQRTIALPSVAVEPNFGYGPQKWWPPNTGPMNAGPLNSGPPLKNNNDIESSKMQPPIIQGAVLMDETDVRNEEKDPNRIAFPKPEEENRPIEEHVVIINEADGTIQEIPPSTTMSPTKAKPDSVSTIDDHLPQLSENLTPPAERPRPPPPYYYHQHGGTARPDYLRPPQRLPLRGKPFPPPPLPPPIPDSLTIRRRPYPSDAKLPNILPQFRPNAKVSHGHRNPENVGTIPAPQPYSPSRIRQTPHVHPSSSRRPLPPAPSYLQRLNPPPPPIHAIRLTGSSSTITENVVPVQENEPTVKRFRHPGAAPPTSRGENDENTNQSNRLSNQKQKLRLEDDETSERYSEEPPQLPPRPPMFPRRRTADPPRVTTLQMIQQRGELEEDEEEGLLSSSSNNNDDQEAKTTMGQEIDRKDIRDPVAEAPVYVVYPVNTAVNIDPDDSGDKDESVVVGTRGPHRPLPPETLLRDDKEREKINEEESTMIDLYNGRPVGDFSYPLDRIDSAIYAGPVRETPILVPSDQRHETRPTTNERDEERDDADHVNVIPYLQDFVPFSRRKSEGVISATLHRIPNNNHPSSTPIAYVYTPTAEASHRLDVDVKEEDSKMNRNDQRPVLLPSQQPSSSSSSAPSPQNFMAPFVASLRAEAPAKNGWNVVVIEPNEKVTTSIEEKVDTVAETDDASSKKTEFDPDNFKPQLFGGFKPIFEFPMNDDEGTETREGDKGDSSIPKNVQQESTDSDA